MFWKKQKKVHIHRQLTIETEPEYWIEFLLPSHIITNIDDRMCNILKYKIDELINKDFRPLLFPPIMQKYLLEVYNTELSLQKVKSIVKNISNQRYLPVFSKNETLIWTTDIHPVIYLNTKTDIIQNPFIIKCYFKIDFDNSIAPNIPMSFLDTMTNSPTFCVKHYNDCVIIMMDIANSSIISTQKTPKEIALMFHEVIKCSSTFVNHRFFPFIRFIEACGDSLLFLHCPDLSLSLSDIHSECIYFALKLTELLNKILEPYNTYIRCGMVAGECAGGVWDGKTFRLSGENINLSARLEGKCKKNHIVISDSMYNALIKENYTFNNKFEELYEELKGLGVHKMYMIDLKSKVIEDEAINIRKSIIKM